MSIARLRLAALAGIVVISFSPIYVRLADAAAPTITFFRAVYALPLLAVLYAGIRRRDDRNLRARLVAFGAGLILAVDLTVWHVSIELIGAGLATVLANIQVLFVGLIAWVIYRERPTGTAVALVPVMLTGVALIAGLGRDDAYGEDPTAGAILGVVAGLSYALFILVLRASNRQSLVPAPGPLFDATVGTAAGGLVAGLFFSDFSLAFTWPNHGWMMLLGILTQTVGWLLITIALPRLAALETSVLILAQPMLALIWAWLVFDEAMSWIQAGGVALVLGGLLLLGTRGSVRPAPAEAPA